MKKKLLILINIATFIIIAVYLYKITNKTDFIQVFREIDKKLIFFIILLFAIRAFFIAYRWFAISSKFSSIKFLNFFRNTILGSSINVIASSSFPVEIAKVIQIKNELGYNKSLILVIFDKSYSILFKFFFLIVAFNFFYFFIKDNFSVLVLSISLSLIFIFFIIKINFKKFINLFSKYNFIKSNYDEIIFLYNNIKDHNFKIFFLNFIIQLINIIIYFIIFVSLGNVLNLIELSVYVPLIEIASMFQAIIFGLKELTTVYIFKNIVLNHEIALVGAILHTVFDGVCLIILHLLFNVLKKR